MMDKIAKAKKLAEDMEDQFYIKDNRFFLNDNARQEYKDIIYKAHNDALPNDHIYDMIQKSLIDIIESEDPEDGPAESSVLVYNYELMKWLSECPSSTDYAEDVISEIAGGKDTPLFFNILMQAYARQLESIYFKVLIELEDLAEDLNKELEQ